MRDEGRFVAAQHLGRMLAPRLRVGGTGCRCVPNEDVRGVTLVEALGADFDPHVHQAVAYEEVAGGREGEVVGVLAKGYKIGDRLLRPAMVKVAKAS